MVTNLDDILIRTRTNTSDTLSNIEVDILVDVHNTTILNPNRTLIQYYHIIPGKVDSKDAMLAYDKLERVLGYNMPSGGGFAAGLVMGLKSG